MTKASAHAWYNGAITAREASAPSIASISFHLGIGVFDGMMAYWNRDHYYLHRGEQHLVRFKEGAARMGMHIPWSVDELMRGVLQLLQQEQVGDQYVRPIAYRGGPELWVTGGLDKPVDVSIFTVRVERDDDTPITCHISPVERISSRAIPRQTKISGAYVNSFNARRTAEQSGFQDGIMLDRQGRITEASAANFFALSGERLLTPALHEDVFPGITRNVVLELARRLGLDACETDLTPTDLQRIDGAFLCSTLMEIRPLSRLGERTLPTTELATYRAVLQDFRTVTHQ